MAKTKARTAGGIYSFTAELIGLTPLILHIDSVDHADDVKAWQKTDAGKKGAKGDDRNPPWKWQGYFSHDGQHIALTIDYITAVCRGGGALVQAEGRRTYKGTAVLGIAPDSSYFPLLVSGKPIPVAPLHAARDLPFDEQKKLAREMGFDLSVKRLPTGGMGGTKHVRVRPIFRDWSVHISGSVVTPELEPPTLFEILTKAGIYKGIGDFRPDSSLKTPGPYGKFRPRLSVDGNLFE